MSLYVNLQNEAEAASGNSVPVSHGEWLLRWFFGESWGGALPRRRDQSEQKYDNSDQSTVKSRFLLDLSVE